MGRSRWRNRSAGPHQRLRKGSAQSPVTVTATVESVTPRCSGMERAGLDGVVFLALLQLDSLLREMRNGIGVPNGIWDEETAVKRYLAYLSMLVDVTLADIAMSAVHSNDLAVLMKERMLVEYANKALYCDAHPDYALYFTMIQEAKDVLKKLRNGGGDAEAVAAAEAELADRRNRFSDVANIAVRSLSDMMRAVTRGGDPTRNDEYVWLYGGPSALMHGDPEGMRTLMPVNDAGQQLSTQLEDGYLNALMVDAGQNALNFCDVFVNRFHPNNQTFEQRLRTLARTFKELALKHPLGRDEVVLAAIRAELQEPNESE